MRLQHKVWCLLALSACDSWFGKNECTEGEQRCDGSTLSTCAAKLTGSAASTQAVYEWRKTASCSIQNLVCYAEDGFAACVEPGTLDSGLAGDATMPAPPQGPPGTDSVFSDAPRGPEVAWTRVEVAAVEGAARVIRTSAARLSYAPPAPTQGNVAAVSFGADHLPISAAQVSVIDQVPASAWVRTEGAAYVSVIAPDGKELDRYQLRPGAVAKSQPSSVASVKHALVPDLPPTLEVTPAGQTLPPLSLDDHAKYVSTTPPDEVLAAVIAGLRRLPPFAASVLTQVAFIGGPVQARSRDASGSMEEAGVAPIVLTGEEESLDAGTIMASDAAAASTSWPAGFGVSHVVANQQAILYVSVSPESVEDYVREPNILAAEIVSEVAGLFMRFMSREPVSNDSILAGTRWAFPKDYPEHVATLLQQRVTPMLLQNESLVEAWAGLHELCMRAELADPYRGRPLFSDAEAVERGFASAVGAVGPADDLAQYAALVTVPELWSHSPCPGLQGATLEQLTPRQAVHLAKLETVWGIGLVSGARLKNCVGMRLLEPGPAGIVTQSGSGDRTLFADEVVGQQEPYYHGQVQVSLTAEFTPPLEGDAGLPVDGGLGREIAAQFTASTAGATTGLFRLTSISNRDDPEVGAGFYFSKPSTYERTEATAGLLLITRADAEMIAGHALMVQQGVKKGKSPFFGTTVMPLITARYDVPEDEHGGLGE